MGRYPRRTRLEEVSPKMARDPVLDPDGLERALERLSGLIPGYAGYGSTHSPQEEDRVLRSALSRQLGLIHGRLERALRTSGDRLPSSVRAGAGTQVAALRSLRDRLHFAPAGNTSLLAQSQLPEPIRAELLTCDAALWAAVTQLDALAGDMDQAALRGSGAWDGGAVEELLTAVEEALEIRESFLRGER
jgi:hypothetical protein